MRRRRARRGEPSTLAAAPLTLTPKPDRNRTPSPGPNPNPHPSPTPQQVFARHKVSFVIRPRDKHFRPLSDLAAADVFQVTMRGKQTVTPTLRLRADGAVLVEFV